MTSTKSPFGVTEYICQLTEYSNRLAGSEQAISDETFIAHLTTTLPETFKNIVDIILHQPAEEQTLAKVISTLIEWEQSEATHHAANQSKYWQPIPSAAPIPSESQTSSALHAQTNPKRRSAFGQYHRAFNSHIRPALTKYHGRGGRFAGSSGMRTQNYIGGRGVGHKGQSQQECRYCGKLGHIQKDCFRRQDQRSRTSNGSFIGGNRNHQRSDQNSILTATKGAAQAELAFVRALTATASSSQRSQFFHAQSVPQLGSIRPENNRWIIDSGASHHLTPDQASLPLYSPCKKIFLSLSEMMIPLRQSVVGGYF